MVHQITLDVPDEIYEPLLKRAQATGQTVEAVAKERLAEAVQAIAGGSRLRPLAGFWSSNVADAGVRHDHYLGQALFDELNEPRP